MAKEPEYKKRCRKCKYSTQIPSTRSKSIVTACYYIGIKQEMRGCPASDCDKFEPRRRGRQS